MGARELPCARVTSLAAASGRWAARALRVIQFNHKRSLQHHTVHDLISVWLRVLPLRTLRARTIKAPLLPSGTCDGYE